MSSQTIIIDGNSFSSLDTFYDEVEKILTHNIEFKTGRNLDAFNDLLRGGFGIHEYEKPIKIIWKNSLKSKKDLSFDETIKYLNNKLKTCHPSYAKSVTDELEEASKQKGQTLFELIVEIIKSHKYIELELK